MAGKIKNHFIGIRNERTECIMRFNNFSSNMALKFPREQVKPNMILNTWLHFYLFIHMERKKIDLPCFEKKKNAIVYIHLNST